MIPNRMPEIETVDDWHDAARARAEDLRREAMADFWRGADAWLGSAWQRAERSARRLAHRRQRRQRDRTRWDALSACDPASPG